MKTRINVRAFVKSFVLFVLVVLGNPCKVNALIYNYTYTDTGNFKFLANGNSSDPYNSTNHIPDNIHNPYNSTDHLSIKISSNQPLITTLFGDEDIVEQSTSVRSLEMTDGVQHLSMSPSVFGGIQIFNSPYEPLNTTGLPQMWYISLTDSLTGNRIWSVWDDDNGGMIFTPDGAYCSTGQNLEPSGSWSLTEQPDSPVPVPEPSTILLIAVGFAIWGLNTWKRKNGSFVN